MAKHAAISLGIIYSICLFQSTELPDYRPWNLYASTSSFTSSINLLAKPIFKLKMSWTLLHNYRIISNDNIDCNYSTPNRSEMKEMEKRMISKEVT